jgi:hypothetical protein
MQYLNVRCSFPCLVIKVLFVVESVFTGVDVYVTSMKHVLFLLQVSYLFMVWTGYPLFPLHCI